MNNSNTLNKPTAAKIFLSGFIDLLLFIIFAWAVNLFVFSTSISNSYHQYHQTIVTTQDQYKLTSGYGDKVYIDAENSHNYPDAFTYSDEGGHYVVIDIVDVDEQVKNDYINLLQNDTTYQNTLNTYQLTSLALLTLVVGVTEFVLFFIVPLTNKNRATIGKTVMGLKTINQHTLKIISLPLLFVQFVFLLIVLSVLPYIIFGELTLVFVPLILFAFVLFNKDLRTIHQFIAQSRTVLVKELIINEDSKND